MSPILWRSRKTPLTLNAYRRTARMRVVEDVNLRIGHRARLKGLQKKRERLDVTAPRQAVLQARRQAVQRRRVSLRMEPGNGVAAVAGARVFVPARVDRPIKNRPPR
jgi:hypothetical protein